MKLNKCEPTIKHTVNKRGLHKQPSCRKLLLKSRHTEASFKSALVNKDNISKFRDTLLTTNETKINMATSNNFAVVMARHTKNVLVPAVNYDYGNLTRVAYM